MDHFQNTGNPVLDSTVNIVAAVGNTVLLKTVDKDKIEEFTKFLKAVHEAIKGLVSEETNETNKLPKSDPLGPS